MSLQVSGFPSFLAIASEMRNARECRRMHTRISKTHPALPSPYYLWSRMLIQIRCHSIAFYLGMKVSLEYQFPSDCAAHKAQQIGLRAMRQLFNLLLWHLVAALAGEIRHLGR